MKSLLNLSIQQAFLFCLGAFVTPLCVLRMPKMAGHLRIFADESRKELEMSFAPDFGMHLVRDGASRELEIHLVPFELDHISVVDEGIFTTVSNMVVDGEAHALSLDFNAEILREIQALCPAAVAEFIENALSENSFAGQTVELPEPVSVAVTAKLGKMQTAEQEQYVPLVAHSVARLSA